MATPKNEAFIDLEEALTRKLVRAWNKSVSKTIQAMERAVKAKDYDLAHKLADSITFDSIDKNVKMIKTMGTSAILLGASRHDGGVEGAKVRDEFPEEMVNAGANQYIKIMKENAQEAVRLQAHITISNIEQRDLEQADQVVKADAFNLTAQVSKMGEDMFALSSNMTVSRLNSFGFLMEAQIRGITYYQVSEVLDSRTCPVCQTMHGQTFPVSSGVQHTQALLTTDDPNTLRSLSPWPKQDKASVGKLGRMSSDELSAQGLNVPPYHPRCRGIVVMSGQVVEEQTSVLGDNALFISGLKRPTTLTDMIFGDRSVLEAEARALLGVNALGSAAVTSGDFLAGVAIGITMQELLSLGYTEEEAEEIYRNSGGI